MSVCLFFWLSAGIFQQPYVQISPNFLYILLDSNAIRYIFRFCGWRLMFSHNRANGPESKTTYMFRPVHQVAALGRSLPSTTASCVLLCRTLIWSRCMHKVTGLTRSRYNNIFSVFLSLAFLGHSPPSLIQLWLNEQSFLSIYASAMLDIRSFSVFLGKFRHMVPLLHFCQRQLFL